MVAEMTAGARFFDFAWESLNFFAAPRAFESNGFSKMSKIAIVITEETSILALAVSVFLVRICFEFFPAI